MTRRNMQHYVGLANSTTQAPELAPGPNALAAKPLDVAGMDSALADSMATTDLGPLGNFSLKRQAQRAKRRAYGEILEAHYGELTKLGKEALIGKVQLLREELRTDWNRHYAVLAERSAAGEMQAIRRFESVLLAGRELLIGDRLAVLDALNERHGRGELTDEEFRDEIQFYIARYRDLRLEFTEIVDARRGAVKNAFRSPAQ